MCVCERQRREGWGRNPALHVWCLLECEMGPGLPKLNTMQDSSLHNYFLGSWMQKTIFLDWWKLVPFSSQVMWLCMLLKWFGRSFLNCENENFSAFDESSCSFSGLYINLKEDAVVLKSWMVKTPFKTAASLFKLERKLEDRCGCFNQYRSSGALGQDLFFSMELLKCAPNPSLKMNRWSLWLCG